MLLDLVGQKFGLLTVLDRASNYVNGMSRWRCLCECGNETVVGSHHLRAKVRPTKSCGCLKLTARRIHGHASKSEPRIHGYRGGGRRTPEYSSWQAMRHRCLNPNSDNYKDYGGRGILICDRWNSFVNFLADMGPRLWGLDQMELLSTEKK